MHSGRRLIYPLLLFAAGAAGMWAATRTTGSEEPSRPPLVALERMGHLVVVKVNYSNIIDFLQPRTVGVPWTPWNVSLGGTKVLLVAKGDCTVASDLRKARYENVQLKRRHLTVTLAAPAPLQARVNFDGKARGGSYFYAITQHGLQPFLPSQKNRSTAVDDALKRAQGEVDQACRQPAILEAAKQNTEAIIRNLLLTTGWTADFVWR